MVNYGVIGCGAVFENFQVKSLLKVRGLRLVAAADINGKRLKAIKQKYGIEKIFVDYHELLADKSIDVVMVNLPQHLHLRPVTNAAKAKKNVYVEKPIATTLKDAREIIKVCQKNKVKLCVGHQRRFINIEMKAKELINKGYLGKIFKLRVIACWYEPRENLLSKGWWYKKECGGGPLMRWGVHKTDTLRYLLEDEAIRVYAEQDTFLHKGKEITVEDNLVALIRFKKGTIAELEVSNSQQEAGMNRGETIEIWGDKGTLWYRPSTGEMELYSKIKGLSPKGFIKSKLIPDGKEFIRIQQKFINSIKRNKIPPVTGEDGYKALEMVVAAYKSAAEKKVITLPV